MENTEKEVLIALENSIKGLTREFLGARAFNFPHELELAAYLTIKTREACGEILSSGTATTSLTHLEWPCIEGRSLDIVIWRPGIEQYARSKWGTQRGKLAKQLPLLAAIQIKRGGGDLTTLQGTVKDIKDLEAVFNTTVFQQPILYFLEWVDHSLGKDKKHLERYNEVRNYLESWCSDDVEHRRALLISRDKVGFKFPEDKWIVDPIPVGTIRDI